MPVIQCDKETLTDVDQDFLQRNGYTCLNWGTVIECYRKNDSVIFHNTSTNIYFKNRERTFKVIVAGSRGFNDYKLLKSTLDFMLQNIKQPIEIISGTADGADKLGERYATDRGYNCSKFAADWDVFGRGAGFLRNEQMAKYANACICFWDGRSRGTQHMINLAKTHKLKLKVVNYSV